MIKPEDILSLEYLKKTEYTGSHQGMRYRLEKKEDDGEKKLYVSVWPEDPEGGKKLMVTVWPEPFNFFKTPEEQKQHAVFEFSGDGITDAIAWMNDRLFEYRK